MALSISSPPQEIISDLRQALMVKGKRMFFRPDCDSTHLILEAPVAEVIGTAHVFDFGHLLDQDHSDCLGTEHEATRGEIDNLIVPFRFCAIIHRLLNPLPQPSDLGVESIPTIKVFFVVETGDKFFAHVFRYILYKKMHNAWTYDGTLGFSKTDGVMPLGWGESELSLAERGISIYTILLSFVLLTRKGQPVMVDPAPSVFIDIPPNKLRNYQKPNPTVGIVKINTKRIIQTEAPEPTGAIKSPHDRRAHYRRLGNRLITVRSSKIHGGALSPTAKIVQMATFD